MHWLKNRNCPVILLNLSSLNMAKDLMWMLAVMWVSHTPDLVEAVSRKLHLYQNVDVIEERLNVSWTFETDLAAACTA